ncbi:MAG: lamin tail domain-containing protein [Planctomycetota bacterium]|jgi:hypothetical protein
MDSSVKTAVFCLALTVVWTISAKADCPVGNLDNGCEVDWVDVQILAENWLESSHPGNEADLDGADGVNMADFAMLAGSWCAAGQGAGSLHVTLSPQQALTGGARWRVDGREYRKSGDTELALAVGLHAVRLNHLPGWNKPEKTMVRIENEQTTNLSLTYTRQLVISEILAVNDGILEDPCEPDEFPDWIEIHNPTDAPVSLDGWYLANWNSSNPDPNLRDWRFPDGLEIDAGGFLVLFASNADICDANAPYLHTSFKLARNNECVALVAPDGNTIVHQFAPYPEQLSDTSYGLAQNAETLVPIGANARFHVPTLQDADTNWAKPGFDDSAWVLGQTALGFYGPARKDSNDIATDVNDLMLGVNTSLWMRIEFSVEDPCFYDAMTLRMRYEDGYIAYLNGVKVAAGSFAGEPAWNSAADSNRSNEDAQSFEIVNLNAFPSLLRPAPERNVLALQALNDEVSDGDFLILPELIIYKNEMIQQYFPAPTPGRPNSSGQSGQVSKVWFSHERGFYDAPFTLILSTEMTGPGVQITYTTDGSRPTATHGNTYNPAFPLAIDRTMVIRAAAVGPGWIDSKVQTHTYIFLDDVKYQSPNGEAPGPNWPAPGYFNGQKMDYGMDPEVVENPIYAAQITNALESIGTMSLVTDLDNLFDPSTGMYVNASGEGRAWERPCSLELIYPPEPRGPGFPDLVQVPEPDGGYRWDLPPDMREGFQIDAGMRIRGGYSVVGHNPKHAFRFFFRSIYGQAELEYRLFGDEGADVYDHIDLRCSQNYSWAFSGHLQDTFVRDVFSRDIQGAAGHPYTRSRYYHLYINGQFWGLFQSQERSEASFAEAYMAGAKEDFDVVNSKASAGRKIVATDGSRESLDRLYDETIAGFDDFERYYRVQGLNIDGTRNPAYERLLDVDNLIDFMIIEYYTGDGDGPGSRFFDLPNNTWGIYNRANPDGFKWLHHDNEHTIGTLDSQVDLVTPFTTAGADRDYFNPHWLHEQLASSNVDYRMRFADSFNRLRYGLLSPDSARSYIERRADEIDMAIIAESARWGDSKRGSAATKVEWQSEIDRLLNSTSDDTCLPNRDDVVLDQFKSVGWYPDIESPIFTFFADNLMMLNPNGGGTIYYTLDGSDPRIPVAQSAPGSEGDIRPDVLVYDSRFLIETTVMVKARVWYYGYWSALREAVYPAGPVKENLRITEIMYHPKDTNSPDDPNREYIELKNISAETLHINLVRFTEGIDFTFADIALAPGQYVVVVKDRAAFEAQYPGSTALIAGEYSGSLENRGERVKLEDAAGETILDFEYKDGWRNITDGGGFSLTIIDPTARTNTWAWKDSWRASAAEGGSPGHDDSGIIPEPGAVVINEVLAHSHDTAPDWIELHNTTDSPIDIGGWYLSDNDANLAKYRIANGTTIGRNGYIVFYEDTDFNNPAYPGCNTPFALSENGEMVVLSSADSGVLTGYRNIERFGASERGVSLGRYEKSTGTFNFVPMHHNTPWTDNAYPKVGPVVITEIMYNPQSGDQKQEFIELHNPGPADVTLYDFDEGMPWKFTDGMDFTFPDYPGYTLRAGEYALVVKNISAYIAEYGMPPFGVMLFGPYEGSLSNAGERLELAKPGDKDEFGVRQYIRVERVNYSDGAHHEGFEQLSPPLDPWPTQPDGRGHSLNRISPQHYPNDPQNWTSAMPTPGY